MYAVQSDIFAAVKEQQPSSFRREAMDDFLEMALLRVPVDRSFSDYGDIFYVLPRDI
jgi:hypothetical protein